MTEEKFSMEDVVKHVENSQKKNRIVNGTIIDIDEKKGTVLIDVGLKVEGTIPLSEFGDKELNIGKDIEVFVVKKSFDGPPVLSYKRAQQEQHMSTIETAFNEDLVVDAKLEKKVKGGLIVEINGVSAFMPASLVGYPMVKNLDSVIGQTVPCKIIDFDKKERNIVVSWRKAVEEDVRQKREELFEQLYPGKLIKGVVTGIKSFGAFLDLGGIDGLLHISELSWGHVDNVEDIVKVGDELEVKIKSFNPNANKIALSLKETTPHPWENIEERYHVGDVVESTVTGTTSYGAFIALETGVEGLARVEEMSWTKDIKHATEIVKPGDKIKVKILEIDTESKKIALSIKQTEENPWEAVEKNYQIGAVVKGEVTHLTDFGAFVMLSEGVEGLIHISDFFWDKMIKHPSEAVKVGDKIDARILAIEADKQKISLGMKQMTDNPYGAFPVGTIIEKSVDEVEQNGAYISLNDQIKAFLHISKFSTEKIDDLREHLKPGDTITAKVVKNNPVQGVLEVSVKAMQEDKKKDKMQKYTNSSSTGTTIKDLIGDKLDNWNEE